MSPIRAVLLDLGGPILNEDAEYARWEAFLVDLLREAGIPVEPERFRQAVAEAIRACEAHAHRAALWRFTKPNVSLFSQLAEAFRAYAQPLVQQLQGVVVREEAQRVIPQLSRAYTLALAGNQPAAVLSLLEKADLLKHFRWRYVSEQMGVVKPAPLFFRMILEGLGVQPQEAVMVGDRLDHDVFPARLLGLTTVRVLVGPYAGQEPPSPLHVPHATVRSLAELPMCLERLEREGGDPTGRTSARA